MRFKLEIHHIGYNTQYKPTVDKDILYSDGFISIKRIFYMTRESYEGLRELIITDDNGVSYIVNVVGDIQEIIRNEDEQ